MKYRDSELPESHYIVDSSNEARYDLAVLLIFFNRPQHIARVFEQVRKARPARLYLYQDGARAGREDDLRNIKECLEIVTNIDWKCEVHTIFQNENFGCDPSEYIAQKWMFSYEEMGVVLEDDDVPSQSLFPFFKELLERYKDDSRIGIICGMNNYDIEETVEESYFFSKKGSIWGWASWRRFIDLWDGSYSWLDNQDKLQRMRSHFDTRKEYDNYIQIACEHKKSGREHYESILGSAAAMHDTLNIVPKYNQITNIGISSESTHSVPELKLLTKRSQRLLFKHRYEIDFPLLHPEVVKQNLLYDRRYRISNVQVLLDRCEGTTRMLLYSPTRFWKAICKRVKKLLS